MYIQVMSCPAVSARSDIALLGKKMLDVYPKVCCRYTRT